MAQEKPKQDKRGFLMYIQIARTRVIKGRNIRGKLMSDEPARAIAYKNVITLYDL